MDYKKIPFKEIKKLLNPDLVDKWSKEGKLQGIHFNKGDLVSWWNLSTLIGGAIDWHGSNHGTLS